METISPQPQCAICGKIIEPGIYFLCDEEIDKIWCYGCFGQTPCGQGKHSEDCQTTVYVDP